MDPRFMKVFGVLTGIDLEGMGEASAKTEAEREKEAEVRAEAAKKRQAEEEARRKAEEEAALPNEEKEKLARQKLAQEKKAEGNKLYQQRKFEEAIAKYNEAVELDPKEILFYTNLAAVAIEQGKFDEAISFCEKGVEIAKEGTYDFVKLGKCKARKAAALFKKGLLEESIAEYRSALLEHNDYSIKEAMKKVQKAKDEADKLAYIDPAKAEVHKDAGNELFK